MAKLQVFLDTNILIDLVANRIPFSTSAYHLFHTKNAGKWDLHSSSYSVLTTFYIAENFIGSKASKKAIKILLNRMTIHDIRQSDLMTATELNFSDYEDACQEMCARRIQDIKCILTRDKKGFKNSALTIMDPAEFIEMYDRE